MRRGEFEVARERVEEALERSADDPSLRLILARIEEAAGRGEVARRELEAALAADPANLKARWALVRLERGGGEAGPTHPEEEAATAAGRERSAGLLRGIVERAPGNLAARVELAGLLIRSGELDEAAAQLEEVLSLSPELPEEAAAAWDRTVSRLQAGEVTAAVRAFRRFEEVVSATAPYQADLEGLAGPPGEATGFPFLAFSHEISLQVPDPEAVLAALRFTDATEFSGLGELPSAGAEPRPSGGSAFARTADMDGDGDQDAFVWTGTAARLLRNDLGHFVNVTPEGLRGMEGVVSAAWGDADDDGRLDLYLVREGSNLLFRNRGDGGVEEGGSMAGVADQGRGTAAVWVDLDHDGDLDLFVANDGPDRVFMNNGNGTFTERSEGMSLTGGESPTATVVATDLDGDVDVDLLVARGDDGVTLYRNERGASFADATGAAGLAGAGPVTVARVGDYDNDGIPDLLLAGPPGPERLPPLRLYRADPDGLFRRDLRSDAAFGGTGPHAPGVTDAAFLDFDNDGHLDIVASTAGPTEAGRLHLFRNRGDGTFETASGKLPEEPAAASDIEVFDYNADGDLDLLVGLAGGGLGLLRNDGGNVNHHVQIRLVGRGPGSGKVNRFGIGSKVELRAGDLYQSRAVSDERVHFGLGSRLKADVIRIVWPNGVPQDLFFPGTDQDLIESQTLKGSCAFVYGWDGEKHVFVTDAMWKSAIGMPLGIMAGPAREGGSAADRRVYAPPRASQEYLRIPGELLRPVGGAYRLQLTEELWEVAYVDEVKLLAVEHPAELEVFVDERFVPPAPPRLRLFAFEGADSRVPRAAVDGAGNDLLPELRARDSVYAGSLLPGPYQGIVREHELVLDLGPGAAAAERPLLFLTGWIFPTDASINVAVAQSAEVEVTPPVLEVPDGAGGWRLAVPDFSFPAGKDKTIVVELGGLLSPEDPRVRIRTNMQVYWDHAFVVAKPVAALDLSGEPAEVEAAVAEALRGAGPSAAEAATAVRPAPGSRVAGSVLHLATLPPARADLHHRGFSREYRKGGRRGPHWFDYQDLSTEPRWLPIPGRYTRYGEVGELLEEADDRYAIMAPGDEMTVEFEPAAAGLAADPPDGWTRTFLLYTNGWIKDADLNTATGQTVEPLPFQAQSAYPPPPGEAFPDGPAHRAWHEGYNTRVVKPSR